MKKIPTILIAAAAAVAAFFLLTAGKKDDDGVITLYGNVDIRQVDMSFRVPGTLKEMFLKKANGSKKAICWPRSTTKTIAGHTKSRWRKSNDAKHS